MMLAAADFGLYGEGEPPPILALAFQCERWNALPCAGGLLDQPAGLLGKMTALSNIYRAHKESKSSPNIVEWGKANPELMKIIEKVGKLRHG